MTSEELRAKELLDKFYDSLYKGTMIQPSDKADMARLEKAKACALIHCDEMLNEFGARFPPASEQAFLFTEKYKSWEKVREAINKM